MKPPLAPSTLAPSNFMPLYDERPASTHDCDNCTPAEQLGFAFDFAFQPIVDLDQRGAFAHEALVRGPNGEGALSVLSQVDDNNRYRFDQACRVKAIKAASLLNITERISINFLPNAVYKPEACIRTTLAAANAHGFPLDRIILEVTEGERIQDGPWFATILREYKRCGFTTAIDDFGAGYAGLTLLADFQPDLIKIDMALVRDIDSSPARQAIVRGLMKTCSDLGVRVIAEGIETVAERDTLYDQGIRLMQGYLFSRPAFRAVGAVAEETWVR